MPAVFNEEPVYFWVSRKADPALAPALDQALARLKSSGELDAHLRALGEPEVGAQTGVRIFRPTMPATIRPIDSMRKAPAGSPSMIMPAMAVPTVPMPVHTA